VYVEYILKWTKQYAPLQKIELLSKSEKRLMKKQLNISHSYVCMA